jgi:monothiol glutaredoxin
LFIKGTPALPKCKFSKHTMQMFAEAHVTKFATFNVLEDEHVRAMLFPQLFVKGEFVGGVDVMEEMGKDDLKELCTP